MSSLYELTNEYMNIYDQLDDPEIDEDSFLEMLMLIEGDIHDKADNYAKIIRSAEGDADKYKKEIERLSDKKKSIDNKIKRMKESLQTAMVTTGNRKFSTDLFSFNVQKNPPTCELDVEEDKVPEKYLVAQAPKVDKKSIIADLKDEKKAKELKGIAHLVQGESLRIK